MMHRRSLRHLSHTALVIALGALSALPSPTGALQKPEPDGVPKGRPTPQQQVRRHERLLVLSVAPRDSASHDGFRRFNESVAAYGLNLSLIEPSTSRESHVELLRRALAPYKSEQDLLVLVADGSSSVLNGDKVDILQRFDKFGPGVGVLFAADSVCWPDPGLAPDYPKPAQGGERFLNSGLFLGRAPAVWDLLASTDSSPAAAERHLAVKIADSSPQQSRQQHQAAASDQTQASGAELQALCTARFLDEAQRLRLAIELDHKAELFQSLHSNESDVELEFHWDHVRLKNLAYLSEPVVVNGNGDASRTALNSLGNYLAKAWTVGDGCRQCAAWPESPIFKLKESELPMVQLGLFIEEATPFFEEFLASIQRLKYPRQRLHLFVHNAIDFHEPLVAKFLADFGAQYASQRIVSGSIPEWVARQQALERCAGDAIHCDHYISLDSIARLDSPDSLLHLLAVGRDIVAPLLSRPHKLWSNFWGSLTEDGFYARSHDYSDIVRGERQGIWNVPHVQDAYLLSGAFIRRHTATRKDHQSETPSSDGANSEPLLTYYNSSEPALMPALVFSRQLRTIQSTFQFVVNTHDFGHLVDPTSYNASLTHPDLYQLAENAIDWEERYLHENYTRIFENEPKDNNAVPGPDLEQPCPDVFWSPLVSELFCQHLIETMEAFGQWSGGSHKDPRIQGGYENVPTRDIHLRQVGLHDMWMLFLRDYVQPVQRRQFVGYEHDPPRARLAFVVRYHPQEQASLSPHHDTSTYTINVALNEPGLNYEGGGCRFLRYNCSVVQSRLGWALMHPGRLTHYHEGLTVTRGTRYILVTFVDP